MISVTEGGGNVKLSVEEIPCRDEEEVIVHCHDAQEKWVEAIRAVTQQEGENKHDYLYLHVLNLPSIQKVASIV